MLYLSMFQLGSGGAAHSGGSMSGMSMQPQHGASALQAEPISFYTVCVPETRVRRYYALFFIEHDTRRVWLAGRTATLMGTGRPAGPKRELHWLAGADAVPDPRPRWQVLRPLRRSVPKRGRPDRQDAGRAPRANAIAGTVRQNDPHGVLDGLLILNRRHLEHVLRVYIDHYNTQRPHRALKLVPPIPPEPPPEAGEHDISRRDRLGGLIHEYYQGAA